MKANYYLTHPVRLRNKINSHGQPEQELSVWQTDISKDYVREFSNRDPIRGKCKFGLGRGVGFRWIWARRSGVLGLKRNWT